MIRIDWMLVAFLCGAYVFVGIVPAVYFLYAGQWILGVLAVAVYGLNLWLLSYAKKKDW